VIRPGQIYEAIKPNPADPNGTRRRIRVTGEPTSFHGMYGYGKVTVETVRPDGTGIRSRRIEVSELHDSATTKTGAPRRNGYVLVQDATEAGQ